MLTSFLRSNLERLASVWGRALNTRPLWPGLLGCILLYALALLLSACSSFIECKENVCSIGGSPKTQEQPVDKPVEPGS